MPNEVADVIVVGAGNAAFCAALAAEEQGAKVVMCEAAPEDESGGNSRFTAGSIRVVYNGVDDIKTLVPDLTPAEIETTDFGTYTADQFYDDMARVTQNRADPDLVELLVTKSFDSLNWMRQKGVRLIPIYGRQAFKIDGKFKFWGGLTVELVGGGPGLVNRSPRRQEARHRHPLFDARPRSVVRRQSRRRLARARARRGARTSRQIGGARLRRVRSQSGMAHALSRPRLGSRQGARCRFNTGDGIRMALDIGAAPRGNWSGCHAVQWEMNAPEFGDLAVGDQFQTLLSVLDHDQRHRQALRRRGRRFPQLHLCQIRPRGAGTARPFAWQIFDQKTKHLQRDEYRIRQITKVTANTIEEFAQKLEGVNAAEFLKTIKEYNAAVKTDVPFNPNVKDGRGTTGLAINKSNWANTIDAPPFEGYAVTCGVTFTFGGLRINTDGEVLNTDYQPIRGLYAGASWSAACSTSTIRAARA